MMAFKKNFVVSLKVNGKILREDNEFVDVPFGAEYSILLKNLNSRRALVNIDIDGSRAFSGLVINANQTVELERFQKKSNKFKFIEKTSQISNHRGDFIDDGFIRVEFQYEKEVPTVLYRSPIMWDGYHGYPPAMWDGYPPAWDSEPFKFTTTSAYATRSVNAKVQDTFEKGITVPGSESTQSFTTTTMRELEPNSEVIVIRLRGKSGDNYIQAPITVNTKIECPICGKSNKSNVKFCSECGTYLR